MTKRPVLRAAPITATLTFALVTLAACVNVGLKGAGGDDSGAADGETEAPETGLPDTGSREDGSHETGSPEAGPPETGLSERTSPETGLEAAAGSCPADAATALLGCPCPQYGDNACVTGEPYAFLICVEVPLVPGAAYLGRTLGWQESSCPDGTRCFVEDGPPYATCTSGPVDDYDAADEDFAEAATASPPALDADSPCTNASDCTGGDICCAEGAPADLQGTCQASPCGKPWFLQLCATPTECLGGDVCGTPPDALRFGSTGVLTCNSLDGGVDDSGATAATDTGASGAPDGDASSSCTSADDCTPGSVCCAEGVAAQTQGSCQSGPIPCGPPWFTQLCATSLECLGGTTCAAATSPALYFDGHPLLTCNPPDSGAGGPEDAPGGD
jgi:hypothetical protein